MAQKIKCVKCGSIIDKPEQKCPVCDTELSEEDMYSGYKQYAAYKSKEKRKGSAALRFLMLLPFYLMIVYAPFNTDMGFSITYGGVLAWILAILYLVFIVYRFPKASVMCDIIIWLLGLFSWFTSYYFAILFGGVFFIHVFLVAKSLNRINELEKTKSVIIMGITGGIFCIWSIGFTIKGVYDKGVFSTSLTETQTVVNEQAEEKSSDSSLNDTSKNESNNTVKPTPEPENGEISVKDFIGLSEDEAKKMAESSGIKVKIKDGYIDANKDIDDGCIFMTSPEFGNVKKGDKLTLVASRGYKDLYGKKGKLTYDRMYKENKVKLDEVHVSGDHLYVVLSVSLKHESPSYDSTCMVNIDGRELKVDFDSQVALGNGISTQQVTLDIPTKKLSRRTPSNISIYVSMETYNGDYFGTQAIEITGIKYKKER